MQSPPARNASAQGVEIEPEWANGAKILDIRDFDLSTSGTSDPHAFLTQCVLATFHILKILGGGAYYVHLIFDDYCCRPDDYYSKVLTFLTFI